MVQEVKYEIAKLLDEKGFPQNNIDYETISTIGKDENDDLIFGSTYSCPTIAQVIMWLEEKHGIWIEVRKHTRNGLLCFSPYIDNKSIKEDIFLNDYDKPTEAYLSAITYILTNLNK